MSNLDIMSEIVKRELVGYRPPQKEYDFLIVHNRPNVRIVEARSNYVLIDQCYIVPNNEAVTISKTEKQYNEYIASLESQLREAHKRLKEIKDFVCPGWDNDDDDDEDFNG